MSESQASIGEFDSDAKPELGERWRDKDWLYQKYWREGLTLLETAKEAGFDYETPVMERMEELGIPRRPGGGYPNMKVLYIYRDKKYLYDQYWRQGKTVGEIAEELPVSRSAVQQWFYDFGIPMWSGGNDNTYLLWQRGREYLFDKYWREMKSTAEIAEEEGTTPDAIQHMMRNYSPPIKTRDPNLTGKWAFGFKIHPTRRVVERGEDAGYVKWHVGNWDGRSHQVSEHRVTAIGEWGLDAVKGKHVHHANGIKWLNVPEFDMDIPELENPNLVPLDPVTHAKQ